MEPATDKYEGRSGAFWRPVYIAVVIFEAIVITALWAFSRYFSA